MHQFQKDFSDQDTKSDKISHHGYQRIYPWFLGHFVNSKVNLLEIGIDETESLKLWQGYFKEIQLYGIDIDEKSFTDPTVTLFKVDQSKSDQLANFKANVETQFDIIIDDGSHVPTHQILTLESLWSLLRPGGVYIIEDIETSYWKKSNIYGYNFDARHANMVTFATDLIQGINAEFDAKVRLSKPKPSNLSDEVEFVTFAHNCIVLVKKNPDSFKAYYNRRPYRFQNRINMRSLFGMSRTLISKIRQKLKRQVN